MDDILKKHNLSLILLHGSQVTGKIHPKSDIDIAVLPKKNNKTFNLPGLYVDLNRIYESDRVDVANLIHANPLLMYRVARKSKLLAGKNSDYEEFQRLAFFKYSDYLPYLKKEAEFVEERINSYANS